MGIADEGRRAKLLAALKPQVDSANISTVCDKRELELPVGLLRLNLLRAVVVALGGLLGVEPSRGFEAPS